jgi:tetratricopeptide (TPR) repeat protein
MPGRIENWVRTIFVSFCRSAVLLIVPVFIFTSCPLHTAGLSFTARLAEIDNYIEQKQYQDAFSLLKEAARKASGSFEYVSIYRRYMSLGETAAAERILQKALKQIPGNIELSAVYTHFLLRQNRLQEALTVSSCLAGTQYGSLNAEAVLRSAAAAHGSEIQNFDSGLYSVYRDCYTGTGDSFWLRNCAVLDMLDGNNTGADRLIPDKFYTAVDAYFWGLVMFDTGRWGDAVSCLNTAGKLVSSGDSVLKLRISALLSDSYLNLGEDEKAEAARRQWFDYSSLHTESQTSSELTAVKLGTEPVFLTDSAYFALKEGDRQSCKDILFQAVTEWPDYVPALQFYARFALLSNRRPPEDSLTLAVRSAGMQSASMESPEPAVPVADALFRMEQSYKRTGNPFLSVSLFDLQQQLPGNQDIRRREAEIYRMLENSLTGTDSYPPVIAQYSCLNLLKLGKTDDAYSFFEKYVAARYSFATDRNFWDQIVVMLPNMKLWECEYAAWFAANYRMSAAAIRLYEYIVFENLPSDESDTKFSSTASWSDIINLAMIYSSTGRRQKSLDLYEKAVGRTADPVQKAETLFRIACIQEAMGEESDEKRSLEYCLTLNPDHAKARQMYRSF